MRKFALLILVVALASCMGKAKAPPEYLQEKARICKDRALAYYEAGEIPEALREALAAREAAPKDPEIYNLLGLIYLKRKDYETALKYFEKAINLDPKYSEALNNVGSVYLLKMELEQAITYFNQALQNPLYQKPFIALTNLAYAYHLKGDEKKAILYLDQALHYNPRYYLAYFYRGLMAFEKGKWETAKIYFHRAVRFHRQDMGSRYYLGLSCFRLGDKEKAAKIWRSIVQLAPESTWALKAEEMLLSLEEKP